MRLVLAVALLAGSIAGAAEAKKDADPLAKFSDEKLADIGFCFQKFCEAVAAKDVKIVAALIAERPRSLAQLDLQKDADKAAFLKYFAKFEGAQLVSSQRLAMGGLGQVTYTVKSGKEETQQMQNCGGRWKLANP
ncbi:MAG: hypothetical protein ABSE73_32255 [Planctomycetota bacterium]